LYSSFLDAEADDVEGDADTDDDADEGIRDEGVDDTETDIARVRDDFRLSRSGTAMLGYRRGDFLTALLTDRRTTTPM
jgi:hypothetical protein